MERSVTAAPRCAMGCAPDGLHRRRLVDHSGHWISQERQALGGCRAPILRRVGQARQLPSGLDLPSSAFHNISWPEGSNGRLTGRFAALRVRCAGGNVGKARLLPEQWLLIQWPADQAEPEKYYLSTLPQTTALNELVNAAHMRWRIERDDQHLKQDLGLGHYEGGGWRGFHHHATLSIAAYGFVMAQRLKTGGNVSGKKTSCHAKHLPFPTITSLAGLLEAALRAQPSRRKLNHNAALQTGHRSSNSIGALPSLQLG